MTSAYLAIKLLIQCQLVFPIDTSRDIKDQGLKLVDFSFIQLLDMEVSHARSVKAEVVENVTICFQRSQIAFKL